MRITLPLCAWSMLFDGGAALRASYVESIKSISLNTFYHRNCGGLGNE